MSCSYSTRLGQHHPQPSPPPPGKKNTVGGKILWSIFTQRNKHIYVRAMHGNQILNCLLVDVYAPVYLLKVICLWNIFDEKVTKRKCTERILLKCKFYNEILQNTDVYNVTSMHGKCVFRQVLGSSPKYQNIIRTPTSSGDPPCIRSRQESDLYDIYTAEQF